VLQPSGGPGNRGGYRCIMGRNGAPHSRLQYVVKPSPAGGPGIEGNRVGTPPDPPAEDCCWPPPPESPGAEPVNRAILSKPASHQRVENITPFSIRVRWKVSSKYCCCNSCRLDETMSVNCGHQRAYCSYPRWCLIMESHGGIILKEKAEKLEEKPVALPHRPPKIAHELTRARSPDFAMRDRRLTAWAMAQLFFLILHGRQFKTGTGTL
jgi:hypothetical protein